MVNKQKGIRLVLYGANLHKANQSHAQALQLHLTDAQWEFIKPLFEQQTFRDHHPCAIVNALFYINKTGCQWQTGELLKAEKPHW